MTLKAFLDENNVYALLLSQSARDGNRCLIQSPAKYFFKVPALFQMVSRVAFPDALSNKGHLVCQVNRLCKRTDIFCSEG